MSNFVEAVHQQIHSLIEKEKPLHSASVVYEVAKRDMPMYERNQAWLKSK